MGDRRIAEPNAPPNARTAAHRRALTRLNLTPALTPTPTPRLSAPWCNIPARHRFGAETSQEGPVGKRPHRKKISRTLDFHSSVLHKPYIDKQNRTLGGGAMFYAIRVRLWCNVVAKATAPIAREGLPR